MTLLYNLRERVVVRRGTSWHLIGWQRDATNVPRLRRIDIDNWRDYALFAFEIPSSFGTRLCVRHLCVRAGFVRSISRGFDTKCANKLPRLTLG